MQRYFRLGLVVLFLFLLLIAAPALAQQPVALRIGHAGSPTSLFQISATKFAAAANDALKGKVDVKVFPNNQLGTNEQVLKGIRLGTPEMAVLSAGMDTVEPKWGVFEMPYLLVSRAQMKKAAESKVVQNALFEPLPAKGMRVLGFWENGFRHVTNNVRPIRKPEDLKGLKVRIPTGNWRAKTFRTYGASPSPIGLNDVYPALKAGAMDGQENPLVQISASKFHEVQKFLSMTGHVYSPAVLVISEPVWKKLTPEAQATLHKIAWDLGDGARAEGERFDKELVAQLAPPMAMNDVDKDAFIHASAGLYEEFGREVAGGAELIAAFRAAR